MKILGLHITGDQSAACLIEDGIVKYGGAEERFTRKKRSREFPHNAIKFCLEQAGLDDIKKIDAIAISWNPQKHMELINMSGFTFYRRYDPEWLYIAPNNLCKLIKKKAESGSSVFQWDSKNPEKIYFVDHHLSHLSWMYLSKFDECAIIVFDEYGEYPTLTLAKGEGNNIKILKEIYFPHSLGAFYAMITEFLGFQRGSDEWKVMGASAYGNPERFYAKIKKLLTWNDETLDLFLDLKYFNHYNMKIGTYCTTHFEKLLGVKKRNENEELEQVHYDIASAAQKVFEDICFEIVNSLYRITKSKNLVITGGVAMNSLFNGKVVENTPFEDIFIPYAAADNGCAIGAALWVLHNQLGVERQKILEMPSPYIGPGFSDEEIEKTLKKFKIKYIKTDEFIKKTVDFIIDGKIVAWFQGRMEFGERALGNRSILADPRKAENKDLINAAIKYREHFRPFAPSILEEKKLNYFKMPENLAVPYMEQVYLIKEEKRKEVPAVTHKDGTGRLQTVNKKFNPLYYELLSEFEKRTGIPVILNTSFNVQGEPIVCTPTDALKTFITSGLDVLVIGKYIIEK